MGVTIAANANISTEDVMALALENPFWSNAEIGEILGVTEATVRRHLKKGGYTRHLIPTEHVERFNFHIDKPMWHIGEAIITADWHIPLYDPYLVNEVIITAREHGIRNLIIGGDFWNNDALSHYDPKQQDAGLEREHLEGLAVMRVLAETFDTIYLVKGNHDYRLAKSLGFKLDFKHSMRLMFGDLDDEVKNKIHVTNLDHMWLSHNEQRENPWLICHPKSYSRAPLSGALKLAAKYGTNVVTAHSHHCAIGYAVDGKHVVAECGGLFEAGKTAYLQDTSTFPHWTNGFMVFGPDGKVTMRSESWIFG